MLEFLEFYNLLGVSHFTFYNNTIGPRVNCILEHYKNGKIPMSFVESSAKNKMNESIRNVTDENIPTLRAVNISVGILPWNLKMKSQKEIRTEGLFASLNDCLYRSMYR